MTGTISSTALAWLLTYAIHSSVLLSLAWLLVRARRWSPGASELLWKSAMLGGILTASAQQWLDVRPAGTVVLQPPAVTTPAAAVAPIGQHKTFARKHDTDIAQMPQPSVERSIPAITMTTSSAGSSASRSSV